MPASDLTTRCSAICSMSRHFLPVLQPDPPARFTTGLTNGSRLPVMEYFLSSCLSFLSLSLLVELASLFALAGAAATFVSGFAATLGAAATCFLAGAVAVLAGSAFTTGLTVPLAAFAGTTAGAAVATAGFAGAAAVFAGTTVGFAGAVAVFAGTAAGLAGILTG